MRRPFPGGPERENRKTQNYYHLQQNQLKYGWFLACGTGIFVIN